MKEAASDERMQEDWMGTAVDLGTTIIGVTYDGGVILGADSRTTTGVYISNRSSDKISMLTDNVYLCRSGSAADTQVISDYVRYFLQQHVVEKGSPADVKTAAMLTMQLAYGNKKNLSAGMIVGGWDKYEGGSIYALPIGGTLLKLPFTLGGSGSTYIYGYCDSAWKDNMTREEAEAFVLNACSLAMARDASSGGLVRMVVINEKGVERKYFPPPAVPRWYEDKEFAYQESLTTTSMSS